MGWWALLDNVNKGILGTAKQQASSLIQWSHIQELHEKEITFYLVYGILVWGLYYGSKSIQLIILHYTMNSTKAEIMPVWANHCILNAEPQLTTEHAERI